MDEVAQTTQKRPVGRPRKHPADDGSKRSVDRTPKKPNPETEASPTVETTAEPTTQEWADWSKEHIDILLVEIPPALQEMFDIPRGLTSKKFLDRARETIRRHYPKFCKSAVHITAEKMPFFVHIPDWARKRFDRTIRLCDLMETMIADGDSS